MLTLSNTNAMLCLRLEIYNIGGGKLKNLKARRESVGMTQSQLADKLGISRYSIIEYESCRKSPTLNTAQRIAAALDTTLDYLIGKSENPTAPLSEQRQGEAETA